MSGDGSAGSPPAPSLPPAGPLEPWPDTVRWQSISSDQIWVELIRLAVALIVLVLGLSVAWAVSGSWFLGAAVGLVLLFGVLRSVAIVRAVRAWGYAEREDDLLVRHGLLVRRLSIVPYSRMQFVDVSAGPLERAFGLATVQLHTAAAATDARVPGLRPAEASRLRDRLTALGEDRAEGL
ncbi:hypothetical protein GA0070610_1613 [Micromonospora echinofusca]|uniref:YdbS-like PH domain-containing protein n=1 Tax=Micromonospora echinofusca TaxID=47858 RepID=A0A1C5G745_MICEH|nr:PH domain-containing protein [Micromonospora echinofusca]SCG15382.1 hypothetical protein GA0070610_1613 [Micromonospora echinofusca]